MVSISTYVGWAGIAIIGAGYWYLQRRRSASRPGRPASQKHVGKSVDARKEGRSKKQHDQRGVESSTSVVEKSQKRKRRREKPLIPNVDESTLTKTSTSYDEGEARDEVDNREFARQFQNVKSGTIPTARPQASSRQRSVKQSQAKEKFTFGNANGTETSSNDFSSNAGADGDDDRSASNSPSLGATIAPALRSGDISDMLEPPTPGPSVVRITEPAQPLQPKKERLPAKAPEAVETKRQRQHRKKNEERKAALAEGEKERRILMEKQRRTAREAEGRAAKDGSTFMDARAPTASPWTASSTATETGPNTTSKKAELLDTFESNSDSVSKSPVIKTDDSNSKTSREWDKTFPSEEEQMRLLEEQTAWNTVTSKKGKKRGGELDQVAGQKLHDDSKVHTQAIGSSTSSQGPPGRKRDPNDPSTFVGESSIDMSKFTYQGKPANIVLDDGDGIPYGFIVEDDEWEVA